MRQYGSFNPGQGIGGSAIHWSGMLWRFLNSDFNYRSHYVKKYGPDKLPEGIQVQDWPITYEELEPYYTQMEFDIGASGQVGNFNGIKIEGGNVFEEPRSTPYPLPPLEVTIPSRIFAQACKRAGLPPIPPTRGHSFPGL